MKRKKFWIGAAACMLIGTASVAASSGVELHEFFNANGERVMYPLATFDEDPDLSTSGPQDQVSVGRFLWILIKAALQRPQRRQEPI